MAKASVGSVPAEANSKATLNESVAPEARMTPSAPKLSDGPSLGERGEYRPASYVTRPGIIRIDR